MITRESISSHDQTYQELDVDGVVVVVPQDVAEDKAHVAKDVAEDAVDEEVNVGAVVGDAEDEELNVGAVLGEAHVDDAETDAVTDGSKARASTAIPILCWPKKNTPSSGDADSVETSMINSLSDFRNISSEICCTRGTRRIVTGCFSSFLNVVTPEDSSSIIGGAIMTFVNASAVIDSVGTSMVHRIRPASLASRRARMYSLWFLS